MALRPRSLSLESLESRLNLSTLGGLRMPTISSALTKDHEQTLLASYKVISLSDYLNSSANENSLTSSVIKAPLNLTASAAPGSVSLHWADLASNESGVRVYRSSDGINFTQIGAVARNKTAFNDPTAAVGATYFYAVAAYNSTAQSPLSNIALVTVPYPISAPLAPDALSATPVASDAIALAWADNATNEAGYHLYRSADGANYTLVGNLPANATTYTDTGLNPGSQYYYSVAAWNSAGETYAALPVTATLPQLGGPVTVTPRNLTSFTELVISGTSGNDSIFVSQTSGILNIIAGGQTTTLANTFGDLVIHGGSGDDTITVDASINIPALVYADAGSDVIRNLTTAKPTIVTLGAGNCTVTGNGLNTAFWVNAGDTVNATSAETTLGGVNRVSAFYQPWSTSPGNPDYIPLSLNGQNLRDPTDSGTTKRLTANSFWGTGATLKDVNQGITADCYFLAPLSSLAYSEPQRLMNMAVDLGDGTYAVRFVRNNVTTYVRVDGDLTTGGWDYGLANQTPGANGNLWGSIFEKAYAFFRTGANTYASLSYGYQATTLRDLGLATSTSSAGSGSTAVLNLINTQLAAGHAMAVNTNGSISGGAPLIVSHVYSIIGAYTDTASGSVMIRLRNPWGVDGAGSDGANDGIVTLTYAQFSGNFGTIAYATV
jgi:hypothetical protein